MARAIGTGLRRNRVASRAGRRLALSAKEFAVLEYLLASAGRLVSAEELLERVWDEAADPFTTAVKQTTHRLRAKLGDPPVIHTVRELTLLYAGFFFAAGFAALAIPIFTGRSSLPAGASLSVIASVNAAAQAQQIRAAVALAVLVAASLVVGCARTPGPRGSRPESSPGKPATGAVPRHPRHRVAYSHPGGW